MDKEKKKYWIATSIWVCPICGSEQVYKSREYTKKPKDWNKRNEVKEAYDYCN